MDNEPKQHHIEISKIAFSIVDQDISVIGDVRAERSQV